MTLGMLCGTDTSHFHPTLLLLLFISSKMKVDLQVVWEQLVASVLAPEEINWTGIWCSPVGLDSQGPLVVLSWMSACCGGLFIERLNENVLVICIKFHQWHDYDIVKTKSRLQFIYLLLTLWIAVLPAASQTSTIAEQSLLLLFLYKL